MRWKTTEGSTGRLLELCGAYFLFYVITGVAVKYFLGPAERGLPNVNSVEYLVYSTMGGSAICIFVVLAFRWYRLESNYRISIAGLRIPVEYLYIIPSGVCTAVVIPTTTLMYTLPISVMVAMVIMRGSVIVISRLIDAILIRQGILHKRVYIEEEFGVVFAILAVSVHLFLGDKSGGRFDFIRSPAAMGILLSYLLAYFIRLYIMNYYRNTRGKGVKQDNKGFFAIEQIAASGTMLVVGAIVFSLSNTEVRQIVLYQEALKAPTQHWPWEIVAGLAYGALAFFSVFLFMFKGRTATFAGLANRLTSLLAGTTATLFFHFAFGGKFPETQDWVSLAFIFIAVGFLWRAERKRIAELKAAHEVA